MTKIEELVNALDAYNELDQMDINRMTACGRAVYVGLDALPELRALRWIPVEERLPDEMQAVEFGYPGGDRWLGWYEDGGFYEHGEGERITWPAPTYWRPLLPGPGGES